MYLFLINIIGWLYKKTAIIIKSLEQNQQRNDRYSQIILFFFLRKSYKLLVEVGDTNHLFGRGGSLGSFVLGAKCAKKCNIWGQNVLKFEIHYSKYQKPCTIKSNYRSYYFYACSIFYSIMKNFEPLFV